MRQPWMRRSIKRTAPLKLEVKAFSPRGSTPASESDWSEGGWDRIVFEVATNPGAAPGLTASPLAASSRDHAGL